ncbi:MAG: DUF1214 domain-containing protein [Burkholderiales bacterium]
MSRSPYRVSLRGRRIARGAAVVLAGVVLGLASAWAVLRPSVAPATAAGPWRASLLAGSPDADPWTRARVAIGGLLALSREETMYYLAAHDSAGAPLRARCAYRVEGVPPPARWWSVTAYADDHFLFDAPGRRFSINGETARLDARGRFAVATGPAAPADASVAWLPTPGDRGLRLVLRVYNPEPSLQAAPASLDPPRIEPIGDCR